MDVRDIQIAFKSLIAAIVELRESRERGQVHFRRLENETDPFFSPLGSDPFQVDVAREHRKGAAEKGT
jgi:hypothetical protein